MAQCHNYCNESVTNTVMNLSPRGRHISFSEVYHLTGNRLSVPRTRETLWIFLFLYLKWYQLTAFPVRLFYCNYITSIICVSHFLVSLGSLRRFAEQVVSSGNPSDFYPEDVLFESLPGHQLSWLRFSMVFLSQSRQMAGECPKLYRNRFLLRPFRFITYHHSMPYSLNYGLRL
jgi:hypothetical protein